MSAVLVLKVIFYAGIINIQYLETQNAKVSIELHELMHVPDGIKMYKFDLIDYNNLNMRNINIICI